MRLTVIPGDSFMSKDGVGLFFDFSTVPGVETIHAIQFDDATGHVERKGLPNETIDASFVAPYEAAWDAEKARLDAITAAAQVIYDSLPKVLERKNDEVNAVREKKIAAGIPYQFPDGLGTIQTRDTVDIRNIQTNVITAMILQAAGEINPVMAFRDMEDALHAMTPAQMVQMGLYTAQVGQMIYAASWQLKATAAGMTVEQIKEFDVVANWSE